MYNQIDESIDNGLLYVATLLSKPTSRETLIQTMDNDNLTVQRTTKDGYTYKVPYRTIPRGISTSFRIPWVLLKIKSIIQKNPLIRKHTRFIYIQNDDRMTSSFLKRFFCNILRG